MTERLHPLPHHDVVGFAVRLAAAVLLAATFLVNVNAAVQAVENEQTALKLCALALERTEHHVRYDPSYRTIPYPGGDVPADVGVCTDLIVRVFRGIGVDLQKEVHEDMAEHFGAYPDTWGLSKPDPNIDHRRVPNLSRFFSRNGEELPVSHRAVDYSPGDIVTWMLPGNVPHIGIVVDRESRDGQRLMIVHNIGRGPELEDMLFVHPITGHYRYYGLRPRHD